MRKLKDKLLELSHNKGLIKVRNYKKGYVRKGITALFLALTLTVSFGKWRFVCCKSR